MAIDTTTEPVLPEGEGDPEWEQGAAEAYYFDLSHDTTPFVPARLAAALRIVVGMVLPEDKDNPSAWPRNAQELGSNIAFALGEVQTRGTYDRFLHRYAGALHEAQAASVTPELFGAAMQNGPFMLEALTADDLTLLGAKAGEYAQAAKTVRRRYSRAQLDAAGVDPEWYEGDIVGGAAVAALRAAYYKAWLEWARTGQYTGDKEGGSTRGRIEPVPYTWAHTRLTDPGNDTVLVHWNKVGGSDRLDGWRADGHLVVDVLLLPDSDEAKVTARVRGVSVNRDDSGADWHRTEKYSAYGELKVQARDINGAFSVVVRDKAEGRVEAGAEPVEPCSITFTAKRAKLVDYALDWQFNAGEIADGGYIYRGSVNGRRVLMIPPPLDTYNPGTVRDPASGERQGEQPAADTPSNHRMTGHATVVTEAANDDENTTVVTADVHSEAAGLGSIGSSIDVSFTSSLEKYDPYSDSWRTVATKTAVRYKAPSGLADADTLTATVPTGELNYYRFRWAARDTYQGGSGVEGVFFPLWRQPE